MPISDYSHIVTLGHNCTPSFQLARVARQLRWPASRISGPFDWFRIGLEQGIEAIETRFRGFFDPARVTVHAAFSNDFWKVTDAAGTESWHHIRRVAAEPEPSTSAWFAFGNWLGQRLAAWEQMLADPQSRILVVRFTDVAVPDSASALERLATALTQRCAGNVRIAAVGFSNPLAMTHPSIQTFAVQRPWPAHLHPSEVDWTADYGAGVVWKGHDASWEELWNVV